MQKSSKIVPKGGKDCHSDPKGVQRVRKGIQRDPKDTPMDTQRVPIDTQMSLKCSQREPRGNSRNSKSTIELSCESELMCLVKVSISLESEFDTAGGWLG